MMWGLRSPASLPFRRCRSMCLALRQLRRCRRPLVEGFTAKSLALRELVCCDIDKGLSICLANASVDPPNPP